jgi:hypothetical protein
VLGGSHPPAENRIRFSSQFSVRTGLKVLIVRPSMRTGMKSGSGFQPAGENRPTLVFSYIFGQFAEAGKAAKLCTNYRRV